MKIKMHLNKSRYQKSQEPFDTTYLYHGTDEASAMKSLSDGLLPRMERPGNWERFSSNPEVIYLSDCYAPFFAVVASEKKGGRMAIVEVQATAQMVKNFLPDEDYLEQSTRPNLWCGEAEMLRRTEICRKKMGRRSNQWAKSLKGLGTVAHKGPIGPDFITRVALIDAKKSWWIKALAETLMLSMTVHHFQVEFATNLTKLIFGEDITYRQLFGSRLGDGDLSLEDQELVSNRDGIEIITNPKAFRLVA